MRGVLKHKMLMKQTKIKIIESDSTKELERKTNKFCENKKITNISLHRGAVSKDKMVIVYNE